MSENDNYIKLEGSVDRIIFRNPENGYSIIDLDTGEELMTVVGNIGNVDEGEELCLLGEYTTHKKYGQQFRAEYCERKLPATSHAIKKYLSSGAVKGIGPTLAGRIVDTFGDATFDIMENHPEELIKVKGISPKKLDEISQEFRRLFGIRTLMIEFSGYGLTPATAVRYWQRWGQFSMEVLADNPYTLCDHGIDVPFSKVEDIARNMGIETNNLNRMRAGIAYVLVENAMSGHTCLPSNKLREITCRALGITEEEFDSTLEYELQEENLGEYLKNGRKFIFLSDYYKAENYIAERLAVLADFFKDTNGNFSDLIDMEEARKGIKYEKRQREAISLAMSCGFMILTGGPGTGKTTTLNAIISLYEQHGLNVMIAAPTGRAAKRISDLTGYEARTIHRMLGVLGENAGKTKFDHNEDNPLQCDLLIIDEMSMVDTLLFESLLRGLKLSCRLIMVGDSDQLPSVGAGNVLKDMIDSDKIPYVKLTEIFRQAQESCIVTNAHKILNGEMPDLSRVDSDFFFMPRQDYDTAAETIMQLVKTRLPAAYEFAPIDDIQVLSPSRKGVLGVVELNRRLQEELNPHKSGQYEVKNLSYTFRAGDKVMQIKNNYDIVWRRGEENGAGIFNGDIGVIEEIRRGEAAVHVSFEGRKVIYSTEMLDQLELAYAITVHKSQGSEFPAVVIPIIGGFEKLYYRSLLYTAVTRAKKILIIVGSQNSIRYMIQNDRRALRYTCLKDMIMREIRYEPNQTVSS